MFFEGSEKKFELSVNSDSGIGSFREFGDEYWASIVARSGAKILSKIENESCTAYLLSESSLFVYTKHVVMLTCGTTSLVEAVKALLEKVSLEGVATFFYERKHEVFPRLQPTSFADDIRKLAELMPGKAFRFGDEADHYLQIFHLDKEYEPAEDDRTLEILMHGVRGDAVALFESGEEREREKACLTTGVREILSGFDVDDHFFEPNGYSLNAIKNDEYYTIHVTPQEVGSYVSFETNTNYENQEVLNQIIERVIEIFRPSSVDIVLFDPGEVTSPELKNYRQRNEVLQKVDCGYSVAFYSYFEPSQGAVSAVPILLS